MQANSQQELTEKKKLIKIDPKVHEELNKIGLRGESFSDIIHRLVKSYKEQQQHNNKGERK